MWKWEAPMQVARIRHIEGERYGAILGYQQQRTAMEPRYGNTMQEDQPGLH